MSGTIQSLTIRQNFCYPRIEQNLRKLHLKVSTFAYKPYLFTKSLISNSVCEDFVQPGYLFGLFTIILIALIISTLSFLLLMVLKLIVNIYSFVTNNCIEPLLFKFYFDKVPFYRSSNKIYSLLKSFVNKQDGYFGHFFTINKNKLHLSPDKYFRYVDILIDHADSNGFNYQKALNQPMIDAFNALSDEDIQSFTNSLHSEIKKQRSNKHALVYPKLFGLFELLQDRDKEQTRQAQKDSTYLHPLISRRKVFCVFKQFLKDPEISPKDKVAVLIELAFDSDKCSPTWVSTVYRGMHDGYKRQKCTGGTYSTIKYELLDMVQDFKEELLVEISLRFSKKDWHIIHGFKRCYGKELGLHMQTLSMDSHFSDYGASEAMSLYDIFYSTYLKSSDQLISTITNTVNKQNCDSYEFYQYLIEIVRSLSEEEFSQVCNNQYEYTQDGIEGFITDYLIEDIGLMSFKDRAIALVLAHMEILK